MCPRERRLSAKRSLHKAASASVGALVTSLFVTPLDVVKTRLQSQAPVVRVTASTTPASLCTCTAVSFSNGLMEHAVPKVHLPSCGTLRGVQTAAAARPLPYRGTIDALVRIPRAEGARALWAGLPPTLLIAVPSTVFYFSIYDELLDVLRERLPGHSVLSPLAAGAAARSVAATVVSPLELLRTQRQAAAFAPRTSLAQAFGAVLREDGPAGLWRGLGATLARDVPFSAIYWLGYETIKQALMADGEEHPSFSAAFLAGATSGMVAAAATTPWDLVKTRRQINMWTPQRADYPRSSWALMRHIARTEGVAALFTGIAPRLAKVAPACALMISSYEAGKALLAQQGLGEESA